MVPWMGNESGASAPVLDESYLGRLAGHLGEQPVRELLADGMLELTDRLARIREKAAGGEVRQVADLAHAIAGAAGHLGLSLLAQQAAAAAKTLRDRPESHIGETIAPMLACHDASMAALHAYATTTGPGDAGG